MPVWKVLPALGLLFPVLCGGYNGTNEALAAPSASGAGRTEAATRVTKALKATLTQSFTPNLAYGALPLQKLDLYMPSNNWLRPRPVVVLIHGGSFVSGDKAGYSQDLTAMLTGAGFAVANMDYRLNNNGGVSITDMVNDVQLALRWMRANASNLGIDPRRVCLDGNSAGGTLAVSAGAINYIYPGDMADQYTNISVHVQCVNDNSGPTTWVQLAGNQPVLGLIKQPQSPPMLVTHGYSDPVVNISSSYQLVDALNRNQVPNQHIWYNGGHVFAGLSASDLNAIHSQQVIFFQSLLAP